MADEKAVCSKCGGGDEFYASQSCQGSIAVIVDGNGDWLSNVEERAEINGLDFDDPDWDSIGELCVKCEKAKQEQEKMHFVECCILQMRDYLKGIKCNKRIVGRINELGIDAEKMLYRACPDLGEWEDSYKEE